jgi:hypothetical protein
MIELQGLAALDVLAGTIDRLVAGRRGGRDSGAGLAAVATIAVALLARSRARERARRCTR